MTNIEREYLYKPPFLGVLLAMLFFGALAVAIWIISPFSAFPSLSLFDWETNKAIVWFWVCFAFAHAAVIMSVVVMIRNLRQKQRIAITPTSIIVPKSRWSEKEQFIEFKDISALSTEKLNSLNFLHVFHSGGKYTIVASMMPSRAAFDELYNLLIGKIQP